MPYNALSVIQSRVAAMLKVASWADLTDADNGAHWEAVVTDAHASGYNDIVGALAGRGFSAAQIADWDGGPPYEIDQALFWALTKGGGLHAYDDKFINKLDRRKDLLAAVITIDGAKVTPAGTVGIGFGSLDSDGGSFHRSVGAAPTRTVTTHAW